MSIRALAITICNKTNSISNNNQSKNVEQVTFDYEFLDDEYSSTYWCEIEDTFSEASFQMSEHPDKVGKINTVM